MKFGINSNEGFVSVCEATAAHWCGHTNVPAPGAVVKTVVKTVVKKKKVAVQTPLRACRETVTALLSDREWVV